MWVFVKTAEQLSILKNDSFIYIRLSHTETYCVIFSMVKTFQEKSLIFCNVSSKYIRKQQTELLSGKSLTDNRIQVCRITNDESSLLKTRKPLFNRIHYSHLPISDGIMSKINLNIKYSGNVLSPQLVHKWRCLSDIEPHIICMLLWSRLSDCVCTWICKENTLLTFHFAFDPIMGQTIRSFVVEPIKSGSVHK